MQKKKVVIVKSSTLSRDVRVPKEIESLVFAGYSLVFLCWNRSCEVSERSAKDYGEIQLRLKAPLGIKVLPFAPIWWFFVFFWLMVTKWDVVHAINFDSVVPTVIAGKLKGKPTIYEIEDTYEDQMVLPKMLRSICLNVDKLFIRLANAIIVLDEMQVEEFGGIPNSKVVIIYDSPRESSDEEIVSDRKDDMFILYHGGAFYKIRRLNIDKCFEAIKNIDGVNVVLAGYGDYVEEIRRWAGEMPNKIKYIGSISHEEALKKSAEADLIFQLRDPIVPVNKYICGCTTFEAMMCGKPLLVNKGTATASKVLKENFGLVVDANRIEEIEKAITKLKESPELCKQLGTNGRKAFEKRYCWRIMQQRLLDVYSELTQ